MPRKKKKERVRDDNLITKHIACFSRLRHRCVKHTTVWCSVTENALRTRSVDPKCNHQNCRPNFWDLSQQHLCIFWNGLNSRIYAHGIWSEPIPISKLNERWIRRWMDVQSTQSTAQQMKFKSTLKLGFDCVHFFPILFGSSVFLMSNAVAAAAAAALMNRLIFILPSSQTIFFLSLSLSFCHAICWAFINISQCAQHA